MHKFFLTMALLLSAVVHAAPAPKVSMTPVDQPIRLDTAEGALEGALLLPAQKGRVPVVLLIAGSGPTDRDGNSLAIKTPNNSLKYLAEDLAKAGIASVRYDKRGVAASVALVKNPTALRFEDYVNDAAGWLKQLKTDPRFSSVTVLGHSEGSLIGMLAARQEKADLFISLAGAGQGAANIMRAQLGRLLKGDIATENERVLAALEHGDTTTVNTAALYELYRPEVQPYMVSWFRYVPTVEVAKLSMPVLIVQGTTDLQVPVSEAQLLATALPSAQLSLISGMNHVMKLVGPDIKQQIASYGDPALPLAPELGAVVRAFLKANAK